MKRAQGKRWDAVEASRQAVANVVRALGLSYRRASAIVQCSASTVCRWMGRARRALTGSRCSKPGRPVKLADRLTRNDVYATLMAHGGRMSDRDMRQAYPEVGRAELRRLKARWRRLRDRLRRRRLEQLSWQHAGTVWAMDFADVPGGLEGLGRHLLVVRDLGSGLVLEAATCRAQDASHVLRVLRSLFVAHGAPLVLKSDNGSAFISRAVQALLALHRVQPLYSPPATPSYNGGCEAGVGSVKGRATALAAMRGDGPSVTLDDVDGALRQIAAQPVDRQSGAPTRRESWARRARVTSSMRAELQQYVERHRATACNARGIAWRDELPHALRASIDRFAVGRALRELRYLMTRRADFAA